MTGAQIFYPRWASVQKPREQIGRDAAAILGRRADVVDRRDLIGEHALRVVERRAAGQRPLRSCWRGHRRRDAAERDARGELVRLVAARTTRP